MIEKFSQIGGLDSISPAEAAEERLPWQDNGCAVPVLGMGGSPESYMLLLGHMKPPRPASLSSLSIDIA